MFRTRSAKALVTIAAAALVGGLAACSTPAAPAVTATRTAAPAATYAAHPTYCAPLAAAQKLAPADSAQYPTKKTPAGDKYAGVLTRVAKAAAADGRKDVADLFDTVAAGFLQGTPTQAQFEKVIALSKTATPVMVKDCGAASVVEPAAKPGVKPTAKPAYCALRAAADDAAVAQGNEVPSKGVVTPADVKAAATAKAVAAAAKADGRADVAAMYAAMAKQDLTAKEPTDAQIGALADLVYPATDTMVNDCGVAPLP